MANVSGPIDITNEQHQFLLSQLERFLPGVAVWAYGSRVRWTARQNSDLDLIVFVPVEQKQCVSELREALAESDLPFLVDLHIWDDVPATFHETIREQHVVIQDSSESCVAPAGHSRVMPAEWDEVSLGDCTSDGQISYGIVQPGANMPEGVPIVRVNNLNAGSIDKRDAMRVSPDIEKAYKRTRLKGGELLLSLVGTTGNVAVVPPDLRGWNVARAIAVIRPREDIGVEWLKLCLESSRSRDYLDARANTTVQKTLNLGDVKKLPIPLPPLAWREEILSVTRPLDEAMAGHAIQTATLEAIARAIFKSWFVDFDPVRAKAEGREPDGISASIAAMFPSGFVESNGSIKPEGWATRKLSDISDLCWGDTSTTKSSYAKNGFPAFSASGQDGLTTSFMFDRPGVVVSAIGANCGETWLALGKWSCIKNTLRFWSTNADVSTAYLFHATKGRHWWPKRGSAQPFISQGDARRMEVLVPANGLAELFGELVAPLYEKILHVSAESIAIAELRDTLLPRLISGKLRIPRAEKLMEAVL